MVVGAKWCSLGSRVDFRPKEGEVAAWDFIDDEDHARALSMRANALSNGPRGRSPASWKAVVYLRFDEFDGKDRRWLSGSCKRSAQARESSSTCASIRWRNVFLGIVIGEFFDRAVDCGTFITRAGSRDVKNSWQLGSANFRGHVVVLVRWATGSARRDFLRGVADHGRATLVGRRPRGPSAVVLSFAGWGRKSRRALRAHRPARHVSCEKFAEPSCHGHSSRPGTGPRG